MNRNYVHQSILLQSRAENAYSRSENTECSNCKNLNGYFKKCRASPNFKHGVCANCYSGGNGIEKCSFVPGEQLQMRTMNIQKAYKSVQTTSRQRIDGYRKSRRGRSVQLQGMTMRTTTVVRIVYEMMQAHTDCTSLQQPRQRKRRPCSGRPQRDRSVALLHQFVCLLHHPVQIRPPMRKLDLISIQHPVQYLCKS